MAPALTWLTPCSDFREKFPESSFFLISPSIGFGNRPVSGRRVTLTRSPTASSFNAFASDSNIAIAPPERAFSKENYINSCQIQFLPHPPHWQFRKIVRERLQDRRNRESRQSYRSYPPTGKKA